MLPAGIPKHADTKFADKSGDVAAARIGAHRMHAVRRLPRDDRRSPVDHLNWQLHAPQAYWAIIGTIARRRETRNIAKQPPHRVHLGLSGAPRADESHL